MGNSRIPRKTFLGLVTLPFISTCMPNYSARPRISNSGDPQNGKIAGEEVYTSDFRDGVLDEGWVVDSGLELRGAESEHVTLKDGSPAGYTIADAITNPRIRPFNVPDERVRMREAYLTQLANNSVEESDGAMHLHAFVDASEPTPEKLGGWTTRGFASARFTHDFNDGSEYAMDLEFEASISEANANGPNDRIVFSLGDSFLLGLEASGAHYRRPTRIPRSRFLVHIRPETSGATVYNMATRRKTHWSIPHLGEPGYPMNASFFLEGTTSGGMSPRDNYARVGKFEVHRLKPWVDFDPDAWVR